MAKLTRRTTGGLGRVSQTPAVLSLSGTPLTGAEGSAFAFRPTVNYGTAPFTFNISAGTIPPWASFSTGTGTISGNPTDGHNGTTPVTIRVVDNLGAIATLPISIVITNNLLLTLTGAAGSSGEGVPFSFVPTIINGVAPFTFSVSTGALPAWATLNTATGEITGTPVNGQDGTTNLTLRAVDSSNPQAQALLPISIVIENTLALGISGAPTSVNEGVAFSWTPTITNGVPAYTFSISSGALPAWASLNTGTGAITGTPVDGQDGATSFTLKLVDSTLDEAFLPVTITVNNTIGSDLTGPYSYLYAPGWTPNSGTNIVARPAQAMPGKATDITDVEAVNPFGCFWLQMTQLADDPEGGAMMRHYYSKRPAFNADSTKFTAYSIASGTYGYCFDTATLDKINGGRTVSPGLGAVGGGASFPLSFTREALWSFTNPALMWYNASSNDDLVIKQWNKDTLAVTTLVDFTSRMTALFGSGVTGVWPKQEGRQSNDDRYFAFQALKSGVCCGYFCWDKQTDTIVGSVATTNDVMNGFAGMSPKGNFVLLGWARASGMTKDQCAAQPIDTADGLRAYSRDFSTFTQINDRTQHGDAMMDIAGNEVWVGVSDSVISQMPGVPQGRCYYANLATGAVTLLPIDVYEGDNSQAMHFTGCAIDKPGVAIWSSAKNNTVTAKYEQMIGGVELKPTGAKVYRYAYHYSTPSGNYYAEPHVVANRTGEIIAWASDYDGADVVMNCVLLPYQGVPYYGTSGGGTGTGPDILHSVNVQYPLGNFVNHTNTMPTPIPAGTGILVALAMDGATTVTPPIGLVEQRSDQAAGSNFNIKWFWKVAAGTEAGVVADFVTSAAERGGVQMWLFTAGTFTGTPQIEVGVETVTLSPDPPPITPSGGTANYWVLAAAGMGASFTAGPSAYPYSNGQAFTGLVATASTNDASMVSCWQKANGATFNPSAITFPGTQTARASFAYTVALKSN